MSVRRLAQDSLQPSRFRFTPDNIKWARETIRKYPEGRQASAVIPLLMRAQEQDGWVTRASIETMADMLDMSYIRVLEVATFYTQFQLCPVGKKAHVQVCGTTPCMLRGAGDLIRVCRNMINQNPLQTNKDGSLSWEEVECQGACVNAPMVMIFKDSYEDLTPERLEEIIKAFSVGKGASVKPGPQVDRIYSAPVGGPTCLLSDPNIKRKKLKTGKSTTKKTSTVSEKKSIPGKKRPENMATSVHVDDLKLISGVGPKTESILHDLGIFTFSQVADWSTGERDQVDRQLGFRGRIERENWIKQAKALVKK